MNIQSLLNVVNEAKQMSNDKDNFMKELTQFWTEFKGRPLSKIPCMGYKELDLFQLYNEVQKHGGYEQVISKNGTWAKIWRRIDIFDASLTDASTRLKKNYEKYLLDFEHFQFPKRKKDHVEREKRHKAASTQTKDVSRDSNGKPIFPIPLGKGIVIQSLGNYKKNGGYPIGFKSSRTFWSMKNPSKITTYTSEIVEEGNQILFVVTPSDDPNSPIYGDSPSAAWKEVVGSVTKNKAIAVSGSLRFGLLHPVVKKLLSELPEFKENKKRKTILEEEEMDELENQNFEQKKIKTEEKKTRKMHKTSMNDASKVELAAQALHTLLCM